MRCLGTQRSNKPNVRFSGARVATEITVETVSIFVVDILGSSEDICMTDELLLFNPKKAASNLQKTFEF